MTAFKAKEEKAKSALSMLKAKITEAEKANKNQELTDAEVLKVILASVKQRKQSIGEFEKGGRPDLVEKEAAELKVLEAYLPKQMSREEIESELRTILLGFGEKEPHNKKVGQSMGMFNKKFPGMADPKVVQEVINSLVAA